MKGILLTGMPYSGKSTVGRKVAKILGFRFFDGDDEIEKLYPDRQGYLDKHGDKGYVDMEARVMAKLPIENSVLAPGGSIIYSKKLKERLRKCFKVYLNAPLDAIKKRLAHHDKRGIVRLKKLGLEALYRERKQLLSAYSDIELDACKKDTEGLSRIIASEYSLRQLTKKKASIRFKSTNEKSQASFAEALKLGLAPDKGLFVPDRIPPFSGEEIKLMENLDYAQLAFAVIRQFVGIDDIDFKRMCEKAYKFDIPIENYMDMKVARLDQGPSLSFKDFAMQLLAQMIRHSVRSRKNNLVILTATSGDTGGAAASAFGGMEKIMLIILMPKSEITEMQRRQMTTAGKNVIAVLVNGKFDDCQLLAKKAFAGIKGLSSANSISIGRLLPQIAYYFYIYCRTKADTFAVPSGNFGNLAAGIMAKRMGLPIKFIAAVNENDEFPKFLETGKYKPIVPSKKCISNAMNVGNPSNLARLIWLYGGRMAEDGSMIKMPDMEKLKKDIASASITDDETKDAIKRAYSSKMVIEPHGAVGLAAAEKLKSKGYFGKIVLLETAHPAKFPEELDALGVPYKIPQSLLKIRNLKERYLEINTNLEELKEIISKTSEKI